MSLPFSFLDKRPIVIAIAGSNGAGKSTFFNTYLSDGGLRFVNADVIAGELDIPAYDAAEVAAAIRSSLVVQRESFVFETVLSDPIGDKVDTLAGYADLGYTVVLIFKHEVLNAFCVVSEQHMDYILRVSEDWYNHRRGHSNRDHLPPVRDNDALPTVDLKSNRIVCHIELGGHLKSYRAAA